MRELRNFILLFPSFVSPNSSPSSFPFFYHISSSLFVFLSPAISVPLFFFLFFLSSFPLLSRLVPVFLSLQFYTPPPLLFLLPTVVSGPRVQLVESGCTEAIYFWHPFLLRLVHPFIICIRFCCRFPVASVFCWAIRGPRINFSCRPRCHRDSASELKIDNATSCTYIVSRCNYDFHEG